MRSPHDLDDSPQRQRSPYAVGSAYQVQKTSALAILSVVSGIMAFPMMCLCFMSIPFSLFAIVSGHMARGIVRQSPGQYSGAEMASFGLLTGYTSLILTGLVLGVGLLGKPKMSQIRRPVPAAPTASEVLLDAAEAVLLNGTTPQTFANNSDAGDASSLAGHFVESLAEADSLLFSETEPEAATSQRTYRAFLQLNHNSCAFLLYVPELDRFTESARKTLDEVAWLTAQRTIDGTLPQGSELAVAVYSSSGSQSITTGEVRHGDEFGIGVKHSNEDRSRLFSFFPPPKLPQLSQPAETTNSGQQSRIDNNPSVSELPVPDPDD